MCGLLLTADDGAAGSLVRTALLLSSVQLASLCRREQLLSSKAERGGGRWRGEGAAGGGSLEMVLGKSGRSWKWEGNGR